MIPRNSAAFFSARRADKCTRRGRASFRRRERYGKTRGGGGGGRSKKERITRGTNGLMMIGQFHTRWLAWVPSLVGNHSIYHLPRLSPYLMAAIAHLARNVDPGEILPRRRCLDRSVILPLPPSWIIRVDIRAPINRVAEFMRRTTAGIAVGRTRIMQAPIYFLNWKESPANPAADLTRDDEEYFNFSGSVRNFVRNLIIGSQFSSKFIFYRLRSERSGNTNPAVPAVPALPNEIRCLADGIFPSEALASRKRCEGRAREVSSASGEQLRPPIIIKYTHLHGSYVKIAPEIRLAIHNQLRGIHYRAVTLELKFLAISSLLPAPPPLSS